MMLLSFNSNKPSTRPNKYHTTPRARVECCPNIPCLHTLEVRFQFQFQFQFQLQPPPPSAPIYNTTTPYTSKRNNSLASSHGNEQTAVATPPNSLEVRFLLMAFQSRWMPLTIAVIAPYESRFRVDKSRVTL